MNEPIKKKNAAVFLDRDDTLIHNSGDLGDPADVELIQGAASAIASLRGLGYKIVVVTNQGGVARGKYTESDVDAVHQRLSELLEEQTSGAKVDQYYYCPYHPQGLVEEYKHEHPDRKPAPGMLLRGAEDLELDLSSCWMVGDQMRDVQAGAAAGTRTILIREDADRLAPLTISQMENVKSEADNEIVKPDYMAKNVVEAVRIIAQQRKPETSEEINRGKGNRRWDAEAVAALQKKKKAETEEDKKKQNQADRMTGNRPFKPWASQEANYDVDERGWIKKPAAVLKEEQLHDRKLKPSEAIDKNKPEAAIKTIEGKNETQPLIEENTDKPAKTKQNLINENMPSEPATAVKVNERTVPANQKIEAAAGISSQTEPVATNRTHVSTESERTLKLILKELRQLKGVDELSALKVFAVVLQMAGVLCYIGGIWLGQQDMTIFAKCVAAGIMIQLGTIAMLLTVNSRRG
ncbi:D-glycero-beta-D-manno-heptose-1,7-bisphosphate 7-phosphatase [Poriferisphaera corsica]|uniref:D,D-heptose 1,7-bisphosphate phosphatase n=1 Tax=Poriferisphaera corsica TaxID=2528020 RepID=A0A517YTG7_9BACT|nr:HAD family hydrolase [Poriferisphaera corsica]QDU33518.1 D-glycero-beta-D-manno-heptose-1,7-bisphosphate 7-phosphatase [Poriferisphaera corsica]